MSCSVHSAKTKCRQKGGWIPSSAASAARANDDNSTFLNGRRSAVSRKRLRKWHGNRRLTPQRRTEEGNAAGVTKRRGEESRESLLCSLIWIARCAARPRSFARRARANLPFFPSTPPPPAAGSDPLETRAARLPWRRRRCRAAASSQIPMQCQPTATPQSAHMNEQRERNFPSKRIQEVGVGDTSLHEISTLLDPFLSRPSHEQCSSAAEDSFVHVSRQRIESWPFLLSASVRPSVMAVGPLLALGSAASAQHVRPFFVMWTTMA